MKASTVLRLSNARLRRVLLDRLYLYERQTLLPIFDKREGTSKSRDDQGHEGASQILRWIEEHAEERYPNQIKVRSRYALHLVRQYTERDTPLAYLLGTQPFGPLDLVVRPPVLIPRPETEEWVGNLARQINSSLTLQEIRQDARKLHILDICSGSGCISLYLVHELEQAEAIGIDILAEAIDLAEHNAGLHGLSGRAEFRQANLFDDDAVNELLKGGKKFDLVVSNPPYIPYEEWKSLDRSVKEHESILALVGEYPLRPAQAKSIEGTTNASTRHSATLGLDFYHRIRKLLPVLTRSRGTNDSMPIADEAPIAVLEIGYNQAREVCKVFEDRYRCSVCTDFAGIDRSVWVYPRQKD